MRMKMRFDRTWNTKNRKDIRAIFRLYDGKEHGNQEILRISTEVRDSHNSFAVTMDGPSMDSPSMGRWSIWDLKYGIDKYNPFNDNKVPSMERSSAIRRYDVTEMRDKPNHRYTSLLSAAKPVGNMGNG